MQKLIEDKEAFIKAFREWSKRGGEAKSPVKAKAAKKNGTKGGRPKKNK